MDSPLELNKKLESTKAFNQQPGSFQGSPEEDSILKKECDDKVIFRWLSRNDFKKGFPKVLSGLTKGTDYSEKQFQERFDAMFPKESHNYKIIVIEHKATGQIIGSGSLIIEKKFIRNAGLCGHIEDIVVDKTHRGLKLGLRIINVLTELGWANACYKVILDCEEHNVGFYKKCGYTYKGAQMARYKL